MISHLQVILSFFFKFTQRIDHSRFLMDAELGFGTSCPALLGRRSDAVVKVSVKANVTVICHDPVESKVKHPNRKPWNPDAVLAVKKTWLFIVDITNSDDDPCDRRERRNTAVTDCHLNTSKTIRVIFRH